MQVLEGLDPVRKRPGMYIGSTGPSGLHHLVWEVVDNSVDEAMAGYCDRIDITLLADGGCRVVDNGRGIPTDINPQHKLSGVEIALDQAARWRQVRRRRLQGVGRPARRGRLGGQRAVAQARSSRSTATASATRMTFADGGKPQGKLKVTGEAPRNGRSGPRRGTTVTFWPDGTVFETVEFSARTILERLQMMAFLNKGLEIRFQRRAARPRQRAGGLQVRGRHRRLRQARQQDEGEPVLEGRLLRRPGRDVRGRGRVPVEHGLQHRRHPQLRQRHQHGRGRHPRRGLQGRAHHGGQQVRPGQGPAQGEGPQPGGRGHPRGHHRHRVGAPARPPVRGPDQGQAGQHRP